MQYFARFKDTQEAVANVDAKLEETIKCKMDADKCTDQLTQAKRNLRRWCSW